MTRALQALTGTDPITMRLRLISVELLATGGMCAVVWMAGVVAGIDKKEMK